MIRNLSHEFDALHRQLSATVLRATEGEFADTQKARDVAATFDTYGGVEAA